MMSKCCTFQLLTVRVATDTANHDSDWVQTRARHLGALAELVANRGWYHIQFPQAFAPYMRLPRTEDVIPICLAMTQAPICPTEHGWLRVLCFDTAATLIRTQRRDITASAPALRQLQNLRKVWSLEQDGSLGWLALSCTDTSI